MPLVCVFQKELLIVLLAMMAPTSPPTALVVPLTLPVA